MGVTQGMKRSPSWPERVRTPRSPRRRSSAPASARRCRGCTVVEVMYEDFLTLAMEQIVNQAAKHRYMSGGQLTVPLTIRTQGGAGYRPAPSTRSRWRRGSSTCRGSRSFAFDADRRPVPALVGDPRRQPGAVLRAPHALRPQGGRAGAARADSAGQARIHREGEDVTVVATGSTGTRRCRPPIRPSPRASPSRWSTRGRCNRSTRGRSSTP